MEVPGMFLKKKKNTNAQVPELPQDTILEVRDLKVNIKVDDYVLNAVRGVNFTMKKGETLGLVGESGCGKSVTSKEVLGINPDNCSSTGQFKIFSIICYSWIDCCFACNFRIS